LRQIKFVAAAAAAEGEAADEEAKVVAEAMAGAAVDEFRGANGAARRWRRLVFRSRGRGHNNCAGSIPEAERLVKIMDYLE